MALSPYRSIRDSNAPRTYARWVANTHQQHGVYVIRDAATREILYVGESHTGRLRDTLQRHFQDWNGKTAGPTFKASTVEVAYEVFIDPKDATDRQDALIREHRPLHNKHVPLPPMMEEIIEEPIDDEPYEGSDLGDLDVPF